MRTKPIIALVVGITLVVFIAILFAATRPSFAGLDLFFMRLNLRFRQGQKYVPLNPFDKTRVFSETPDIVSEEFVESETNKSGQGNFGK